MSESTQPDGTAAPRLLNVLRETLRVRHYSLRTEQQYVNWVRRFLPFHHHRHPREMGAAEVSSLLTHLAVEGPVSASTQNQALPALRMSAPQGRRVPSVSAMWVFISVIRSFMNWPCLGSSPANSHSRAQAVRMAA